MTWTDEQINEYSVYLDRQEQLVLMALQFGIRDLSKIEEFVKREIGDADHDYIEMVYNIQTHPDRKIPLEVM
jgi:hypothetical protein